MITDIFAFLVKKNVAIAFDREVLLRIYEPDVPYCFFVVLRIGGVRSFERFITSSRRKRMSSVQYSTGSSIEFHVYHLFNSSNVR